MIMIPFFMVFLIFPEILGYTLTGIVAAAIFALTSLTDMLDGKIARKYGLVTDFGKFLDPLADKLMVFGAMVGILTLTAKRITDTGKNEYRVFLGIFAIAAFIIIFRELAVTSMRLIVSGSAGIVVAANIFGKLKTVSQIAGIIIILIEPIIWDGLIASYVMVAVMVITTLFSGFDYFRAYWPYINSNK